MSNPVPAASERTLPPGYIHLGVSKEIVPTLQALGVDPEPVIRAAGLDPRLFDDGMNVIPFAALGRLYTLCVARTGCPHFGLLVGRRASILSLGLVGRLMRHSNTIG
ncbi:AraC family transcriptional regulator ligand-binding domain-containing protein, partial [Microvirga sp. 0TCS3.31]